MEPTVMAALIGAVGSALGAGLGVLASAKLTTYRLQKLEDEVRKHNDFARRMPVLEEQIKVANHRIADLEEEAKDLERRADNE